MYQKLIIVGNLGGDPEMRYTPSGTPVTHFSVATNRRWTNQQGEQQDETTWFRVSCWDKLAETTNQYLSKGRPVLIEGTLIPDSQTGGPRIWTGNDGIARASFEVRAWAVRFLPSRQDREAAPFEASEEGLDEEEIPF
ncbi:MAG: single-stranded DNA-binding protein [Anaerolineae bacterium]